MHLISFLSNIGNARVEVSCYNSNLRDEAHIDWIEEPEIYCEYENVQDPSQI